MKTVEQDYTTNMHHFREDLGTETIIFDSRQNKSFHLNPSAAVIYRNYSAEKSAQDYADLLKDFADTDELRNEVAELGLQELRDAKLIENASQDSGISRRTFIERSGKAAALLPLVTAFAMPDAAAAASLACVSCGATTGVAGEDCQLDGCPDFLPADSCAQCSPTGGGALCADCCCLECLFAQEAGPGGVLGTSCGEDKDFIPSPKTLCVDIAATANPRVQQDCCAARIAAIGSGAINVVLCGGGNHLLPASGYLCCQGCDPTPNSCGG